jgi:hypothetical protein
MAESTVASLLDPAKNLVDRGGRGGFICSSLKAPNLPLTCTERQHRQPMMTLCFTSRYSKRGVGCAVHNSDMIAEYQNGLPSHGWSTLGVRRKGKAWVGPSPSKDAVCHGAPRILFIR